MEYSDDFVTSVHTTALHTIALAEQRWARRRAETEPANAMLWLRAARAAWAAGDGDEAAAWYRRAADGLLLIAQQTGQVTGTYPYYAELTLGAAALSGTEPLLERAGDAVRYFLPIQHSVRRIGRAADRPGDAALASKAVVCAWASWMRGAEQDAVDLLRMAEREVHAFTSEYRHRWHDRRWSTLMAAVHALLRVNGEALHHAIRTLDRKAVAGAPRPPTPSTLVDETVVVLAAEWRRNYRQQNDLGRLHTLVQPGFALDEATETTAVAE